jgi:uncharacterized protein (DUF433 family)
METIRGGGPGSTRGRRTRTAGPESARALHGATIFRAESPVAPSEPERAMSQTPEPAQSEERWSDRVAFDPTIHHGEPCIAGTRVAISVIVGSIADGDTPAEIIASYPQLKAEDIRAALRYAAEAVRGYAVHPNRRAS